MIVILQRVSKASVTVDEKCVASIDSGLLALVGIEKGDSEEDTKYLAGKTTELRIFADQNGKMNKSVQDIGGKVLAVSQFTLLAEWRKGRRPGFTNAASPEEGNRLYEKYVEFVKSSGVGVETGIFAADMQVELINDGPVTLVLDTNKE